MANKLNTYSGALSHEQIFERANRSVAEGICYITNRPLEKDEKGDVIGLVTEISKGVKVLFDKKFAI